MTKPEESARRIQLRPALIDATRPWEWRDQFPPINVPRRDVREAAKQRWGYLLG